MAKFASILETVGNTPVVKINKLAPDGRQSLRQGRGLQSARLGQGPPRARRHRGRREDRRAQARPDRDRGDLRQHRHRARDGVRRQGLSAGGDHGGDLFSVERRKLMRFLGAKVVLTPAAERGIGMVNKAQRARRRSNGWFLTRQFENEANADMHSRTTAREIVDDFKGEKLDYWVTGFGTGGTLKGVARVLRKETARHQDRGLRAGRCADARPAASAAGAQPRRLAGQEPSGLEAASDAGLESGLHPEAHRRRRRHAA